MCSPVDSETEMQLMVRGRKRERERESQRRSIYAEKKYLIRLPGFSKKKEKKYLILDWCVCLCVIRIRASVCAHEIE